MEILDHTALFGCNRRRKTSGGLLLGTARFYGKRMNRSGQFLGQRRVDPALAFNSAKARESRGNDFDGEMRLPFRTGAGMTGMSGGIIDDVELHRLEAGFELGADSIGDTHGAHAPGWLGGSHESVLPSPEKSRSGSECRARREAIQS